MRTRKFILKAIITCLFLTSTPALAQEEVGEPDFSVSTSDAVGFGFGILSSSNSLFEWSPQARVMWWATDSLGVGGGFRYAYSTNSEDDAPSQMSARGDLLLSYVLAAGETTRLCISGGVGFQYDSETVPFGLDGEFELKTSTNLVTLPIALGVEHFFTDTIALSVGAGFDLLRVGSEDDGNDDTDEPSYYFFSIDTTQLFLNLTWYTD